MSTHVGPYTPRGAVIRSVMERASDAEGLRLYPVTALGDRYEVRVADDGSVIGLRRSRLGLRSHQLASALPRPVT
jgi:hypothetical protein